MKPSAGNDQDAEKNLRYSSPEIRGWLILVVVLALSAACSTDISSSPAGATPIPSGTSSPTPFLPQTYTVTAQQKLVPLASLTPEPTPTATLIPSPTPEPVHGIWAAPGVPDALVNGATLPAGWLWVERREQAQTSLEVGGEIAWVYVLAGPFATVADELSLQDLKAAWQGERLSEANGQPLLMDERTLQTFSSLWGAPGDGAVMTAKADELADLAWKLRAWAILPFERLEPRWKVLRIDGKSPLDRGDLSDYALTVGYGFKGGEEFAALGGKLPPGNRDPKRMTTLLMTGTTALVRATGYKMETKGMTYPGEDIRAWTQQADFVHISSESSFNPVCPPANPNQKSLMFCSRPEYIQLLDSIGANIIELSGNHNNDWGRDAFTYSLDLFRQRGWKWFAGGANAEEARAPLLLEHHGNRIALIGCNYAGPESVWATKDEPGAAHCNLDWLDGELGRLKAEGYLPVMTFQYNEIYQMKPSEGQTRDFRRAAQAGAVIVSGSQAHFPQTYELQADQFIHYGLGNFFFDQMDTPVDGTRRELLDQHVFYAGKHISTVVLTAMLEDYARPRPMTLEERRQFLGDIFQAAGW